MTTKKIRALMLAQPLPLDIDAAIAENGGIAPAPLCWVCLEVVEEVPDHIRDAYGAGLIREPNLPVITAEPGHRKHKAGAVLHTRCAPGTARWARHQNPKDPAARAWLVRFGYDPDGLAAGDTEDMMAAKKAKAEKQAKRAAKAPKIVKNKAEEIGLSPGTILRRPYKGKDHDVKVLSSGFEYKGEVLPSLTAAAMAITGYKAISGPAFFRKAIEEKTGKAA